METDPACPPARSESLHPAKDSFHSRRAQRYILGGTILLLGGIGLVVSSNTALARIQGLRQRIWGGKDEPMDGESEAPARLHTPSGKESSWEDEDTVVVTPGAYAATAIGHEIERLHASLSQLTAGLRRWHGQN